jgi:hypothetical protein
VKNVPKIIILTEVYRFGLTYGGGNRSTWEKPPACRKSLTNLITYCCIEYTPPWTGFELTTLVVIGTDYTGSCNTNYNTITTTTAPEVHREKDFTFLTICINKRAVFRIYMHFRLYAKMSFSYLYISFYRKPLIIVLKTLKLRLLGFLHLPCWCYALSKTI